MRPFFLALCGAIFIAGASGEELRLATTSSVENSGLLARILPDFEQQCECAIRVIPVGSGKALALGRRGDVDALIVHAPADEKLFIAAGHGIGRRQFMHNHFILLGPPEDPAAVLDRPGIMSAMVAVADSASLFVSRGDHSGTHKMELSLWRRAGRHAPTDAGWYLSAGVGMGQALIMANELRAYVLSDHGTYLHFMDAVDLLALSKDEPALLNPYSIIRVNPRKHPHVNATLAERFSRWLTSDKTQRQIGAYRVNGERLFTPAKP